MSVFLTSEERQIFAIYKEATEGNAGKEVLCSIIKEGILTLDDPRILDPMKRLLSKMEKMSDEELSMLSLVYGFMPDAMTEEEDADSWELWDEYDDVYWNDVGSNMVN